MKKYYTLLIVFVMICSTFLFVGCKDTIPEHTHDYQTTYSYNDTNHWYSCKVDGCEDKKNNELHTFNDDYCSICGYLKSDSSNFSLTTNISNCTITGKNIDITVSNNINSYSFVNAFNIPSNFKWELHWDRSCLPTLNIISKSVDLELGNNILYALFINKNDDSDIYLYEINLHRQHTVTVSYYYNNQIQHQENVITHELFSPTYILDFYSCKYRFNYWEDKNGEKVSGTNIYVEDNLKLYANVTNFPTETITVQGNELSNYITIKNIRVVYDSHSGLCNSHPWLEFDVVFELPKTFLALTNVDVKIKINGNWAVEDYSIGVFNSGYDENGTHVYSNSEYHLRFNYNNIDLEECEQYVYSKHFKAETSGNACDKELLSYNVGLILNGSFKYEILTND